MYNNNPGDPNNQYNYPPNVPYQQQVNQNPNPDAYFQSNPNIYSPPPYNNSQNPPQQYYPPPPPPPPNYLIQGNQPTYLAVPIIQPQVIMSREPTAYYCPYCSTNVVTEVRYEPGDKTSLMACCLCFFGGVICCLIPYCVNDCQDAIHLCPLCKSTIGKVPF